MSDEQTQQTAGSADEPVTAPVVAPVAAPAEAPQPEVVSAAAPQAPEAVAAPAPAAFQAKAGAMPASKPMGGRAGMGAGRPGMGGRGGMGGGRPGMGGRGGAGGARRNGPGGGRPGDVPVESDYEEKNIEIARVTRVTKGGKRMRFRALTVIGNRKGRVGFGLAKGLDVQASTGKAVAQARKGLFTVPLKNDTIPHPVEAKFAAARIILKPAPKGTGVKAGGAVRIVLELAGVPNVVSKILGSSNKINNVKATFAALKMLRIPNEKPAAEPKADTQS